MSNYLILFASNGNNIGKTTTANRLSYFLYENLNKKIKDSKDYDKWLSNTDYNTQVKSFATPIRDISNSFFKILFNGQDKITFETFFSIAKINPNASLIKGIICGYRIEEIENTLTKQVRYLDKLVDELAKGKKMEKILRTV